MSEPTSASGDERRLVAVPVWSSPAVQIVIALSLVLIAAGVHATVATGSPVPVLLIPIAATLGPLVGLFSGAAYFTLQFKLALLGALTVGATLTIVGWRLRERLLARAACVLGVVVWVIGGFIGFGPQ